MLIDFCPSSPPQYVISESTMSAPSYDLFISSLSRLLGFWNSLSWSAVATVVVNSVHWNDVLDL